jgi:hypothetical protein
MELRAFTNIRGGDVLVSEFAVGDVDMSERTVTTMTPRISLNVEVPEELHSAMVDYVENHPAWSQHRVFCAALSLFLMQNGVSDRRINRLYLDAVFDYAA